MPSDPSKAGRIGGSRNTPAQQAARKKNGFQPKRVVAMVPEPAPKVAAPCYPKPEPVPAPLPFNELDTP
jgi:hypothetical protein